ncbi:MAG: hypothetical protein PHQ36_09090, partial [Anaerolineales bacterium]|nr:hypothetical protein [Anaerolineales bacterium]
MFRRKNKFIVFCALMCGGLALMFSLPLQIPAHAQQPTGSIPTVTGTPSGAIVALYLDEAHPQETVYAGPSSYLYPAVGVILAGQELPAYGYSENQSWIQIYYPGVPGSVAWVYAPYVKIVKIGPMPKINSPSTPTPASTPIVDIDPTLMAAFVTPIPPTRLPTFTAPAPLANATFAAAKINANRLPMGLLIFFFGFVGSFGVLISFLR